MATPPAWATRLATKVAKEHASRRPPTIEWRQSRVKHYTSGRAWPGRDRIVITAGIDRRDQKLVLLHEMAHWLAGPNEDHGPEFWDLAYMLYTEHGVYRLGLARESNSLRAARRRALTSKNLQAAG